MQLVAHPANGGGPVSDLVAYVIRVPNGLRISFNATGDMDSIMLPADVGPARTDELWRHTCFEIFLRSRTTAYAEYNFATSGAWAAYGFDGHRDGMHNLAVAAPAISVERDEASLCLNATVGLPTWLRGSALECNLTAVIEATDGTRHYWALAYGGGPPDFHDPSCFLARLPE